MRSWKRSIRPDGHPHRASTKARGPSRNRRFLLETLEDRSLLSTYTLSEGWETIIVNFNIPVTVPFVTEQVDNNPATTTLFGSPFVVSTGSGSNTVNILDTSAGIPIDISGGGSDTVNVGSGGSVQGIVGAVSVQNPPNYTTLNIDDSADATARTVTLSTYTPAGDSAWGSITGLAPAAINYKYADTRLTGVHLNTGSGGDPINVLATGVPTYLSGGGADTVNVGDGGSVQGIQGALILENEPNLDTVNINDQNDPVFQSVILSTVQGKTYNFTGGQLSGLVGVAPITWDYSDTAAVYLNTGSAGATVTVLGTGVPTFINGSNAATNTLVGGNLQTTWQVNSANAGTLSNGVANVTFAGFQNLTSTYDEDRFYFANGATLSGTLHGGGDNLLGLGPYTTNLTVNITGGGAGNLPGVVGAFQGVQYLTTGSGNDRFVFGNNGYITGIWSNGGTNTLDASAVSRGQSVSVYGANKGTVPGMVFEFYDIANFTGGSGNNTFVFSDGASLAGTLNGGSGTNLIDTSPYTTGLTFSIRGANSGSAAGLLGSFNHVQNLIGAGGGGNAFAIFNGGSLSGEVDGGVGGNNWLDYAAYTTAVTVNLATNTATGIDGGLAGGIANIRDVRGGQGGDTLTGNALGNILIGGAGPNSITGGTGRSLLIGGKGKDTVTGGSGNDLLIAGSTDYDTSSLAHDRALEAILAEWQSADSYTTRIAKIKAGVGSPSAKLVWGTTVHDNSTSNANKLTGGGEPGAHNWFFFNPSHTTTNKSSGEQSN
jgi:hypothetical protein